ncbi:protein of unknown function [Lactobacillus delbrueckii subsp. delbrueckii]|uniref:Shikimate dehydrogenase substrate binding N-terminal domain-containing protein n=1 Tax=Lactobacillus delbrueckii subsp. delbrueckii TaxID=83684 RepID=A0AAU9R6J5_9LACO|nr:protein of unknown function [Lactobacillus delbrueckii subsp. delbrueckii]
MADERNNEIEETKIQGVNGPITGWLDGHTILVGLMAYPIRHTMSPTMHNNAFAKLGLNGAYLCFEMGPDRIEDAVKALRGPMCPCLTRRRSSLTLTSWTRLHKCVTR